MLSILTLQKLLENILYLNYGLFYHSLTNGFSLVGRPTFYNPVVIFALDMWLTYTSKTLPCMISLRLNIQ